MDGATEKRLAWLLALGLGLVIAWLIATDPATIDPEPTRLSINTPSE